MMHKPVILNNLNLSFPHKICFENFSTQINCGSRIAIIGRNGSGKSTLLKMIQNHLNLDIRVAYVPQIIEDFNTLSGGQRFNKMLTKALNINPNLLLLDEPTNHLDALNRKSLMRMLKFYNGTLIIVTHDLELMTNCLHTIWHIDNEKIQLFTGHYDDYNREIRQKRASIEKEISRLDSEKKQLHHTLMKEQSRSAKSRRKGEKSIKDRKWPTIVSNAKALRAEETSGRKKNQIVNKKNELTEKLSALQLTQIILPTFSITASDIGNQTLVSVNNGSVGYEKPLIQDIYLSLTAKDRLGILGDNGSGKTTLIKAIIDDEYVKKTGDWYTPNKNDIGYLDQHYQSLNSSQTVLESLIECVPTWDQLKIRRHLCDFLFRKNEEVNALIRTLSGGEKARLSLALIAAKTPKVLILDEVTNNVDLETRDHIIQVLKAYPGLIIAISHDNDFMASIGVNLSFRVLSQGKK